MYIVTEKKGHIVYASATVSGDVIIFARGGVRKFAAIQYRPPKAGRSSDEEATSLCAQAMKAFRKHRHYHGDFRFCATAKPERMAEERPPFLAGAIAGIR